MSFLTLCCHIVIFVKNYLQLALSMHLVLLLIYLLTLLVAWPCRCTPVTEPSVCRARSRWSCCRAPSVGG